MALMIRTLLSFAALISLTLLALGFTGRILPLGDSLSVFRLPNLLLLSVLMFALIKTRAFYLALGLTTLSAISIATNYVPQEIRRQSVYRLYQKNISYLNTDTSALKADILAVEADFITLQESTKKNLELASEIKTYFPYQLTCSFNNGVTIISRWPSTNESHCFKLDGVGAMKVKTPTGPLWVLSVHLYWPYPYAQSRQVKRAIQLIEGLEGPKIIAGDFNMVPWSYSIKAFERASDTKIARPAIHSFDLPCIPMRIPIDHVLLPIGSKVKIERRDKKGSDHYGVLATFNLP